MRTVFKSNRLTSKDYARIIQIVQQNVPEVKGIVVNSVESIKGKKVTIVYLY